MNRTDAEFDAKEKRIDDLVAQAAKLVADLNETVADMKRILDAAAQAATEAQQQGIDDRNTHHA
jgi:ABC-type transporter Mla subunit MlaD